jgi:hypothetical protein
MELRKGGKAFDADTHRYAQMRPLTRAAQIDPDGFVSAPDFRSHLRDLRRGTRSVPRICAHLIL